MAWEEHDPAAGRNGRQRPDGGASDWRRTIGRSCLGRIEDASYSGLLPAPAGHSGEHQIVLPYRGAFVWKTGSRSALVDLNQTLYVAGGEDFSEDYPAADGMACVVITPTEELLERTAGRSGKALSGTANFRRQTRAASPRLRLLTHALRHRADGSEPLVQDETMIAVLREAFSEAEDRPAGSAATRRVVERAKAVLTARSEERLSLDAIAGDVGVSGVYLTQVFSAFEGMPLYRYQTRLRLARALARLPGEEDLTRLALDLGFSSHAHFSAAFRKAYGITPSAYRAEKRGKSWIAAE